MKTKINKVKLAALIILVFSFVTCVENHLLPNFGTIIITSDPVGAEIFLNDENTGKVTPDSLIELLSGNYNISIKMAEFIDTSFSANVNDGQKLNYDIFLIEENPQGEITLNSEPEGAVIFINNNNTGEVTPHTFSNLERGNYQIKLSLNLYDDSDFEINLEKDEAIEKNTRMIIAGTAGSLFLNSRPEGASIILDNFNTGFVTPDTLKPLASGLYSVKLELENYKDTSFVITVASGTLTTRNVILRALYNINVSVNPNDGGSVVGSGGYIEGENVSLIATPNTGYSFVNWTENDNVVSTDLTYQFIAESNRELIANFSLNTFLISTSENPSNGGTTSGGGTYNYGEFITVGATPELGFSFVNWTENDQEVSSDIEYSFTVNQNRNLVANFSINNFVISTSSNPQQGGSTSGGGGFDFGEEVTVTATPSVGYTFLNWTENDNEVSTDQNYTFTVSNSRNLVANFVLNTYTISATVNPVNAGNITGTGTFNHGETVNLSVSPNFGYSFVNWTENDSELSQNPNYSFTALEDRNITANFIENGILLVNSDPTGAEVLLEGDFKGQTPLTTENLIPGEYQVTLKLEDFADTSITTQIISGQTTNLGTVFLRDITPEVEVKIDYELNDFLQLVFIFEFNQDIRFNRVEIVTPEGNNFTQNYGGVLLPEGVEINWIYPEEIKGEWKFNFIGRKVGGRQDSFEFEESKFVE